MDNIDLNEILQILLIIMCILAIIGVIILFYYLIANIITYGITC